MTNNYTAGVSSEYLLLDFHDPSSSRKPQLSPKSDSTMSKGRIESVQTRASFVLFGSLQKHLGIRVNVWHGVTAEVKGVCHTFCIWHSFLIDL